MSVNENNTCSVVSDASTTPTKKTISPLSLFPSAKPYRGFANLPEGNHEIHHFRWVKNKHYRSDAEKKSLERVLLVELKDEILFLPEYFAKNFDNSDELIDQLNNDGVKKFLAFNGKRNNK